MKKIAICCSLCCTAALDVKEDGLCYCSECKGPIEGAVFNLGVLDIIGPGDTIHMAEKGTKSVEELDMAIEPAETPDTICGRLKEAYWLLEDKEGQIATLLKMCVVYAKRMSTKLKEYHDKEYGK